jgi:GWxTD domain-containing protein
VSFDADSVRWYVEAYGLPRGTRLAARVIDLDSVELWRDTVVLGDGPFAGTRFAIKPGVLPPGRAELQVQAVGGTARATAPFLVTFSDLWAVKRFDQLLDVLRFYDRPTLLATLKAAPRDQRVAAWQAFYTASDSLPATPRHERLERYFHRVDLANQRFSDPAGPGWKTDRGEVFITLGEPDQAFEVPGKVAPGIRWEYRDLHVTLAFQDDDGWGKYHLTVESRSDYEHILAQVRGAQ